VRQLLRHADLFIAATRPHVVPLLQLFRPECRTDVPSAIAIICNLSVSVGARRRRAARSFPARPHRPPGSRHRWAESATSNRFSPVSATAITIFWSAPDDRQGARHPNVTLVGIVSADIGLGLPDFRAAERTFQLLTQAAGSRRAAEELPAS